MNRPAFLQTISQLRIGQAELSRPLRHRQRLSVMRQMAIRSHVVQLHDPRHPAHIAGFVGVCVVDAVQRVRGLWAGTDIGKKCREGQPSVADGNASASVVFECRMPWIQTARLHASPDVVFGRGAMVSVVAMRGRALSQQVLLKASARLDGAIQQMRASGRDVLSAIAAAGPFAVSLVGQGNQPSETLANQVKSWWASHSLSLAHSVRSWSL